jgi:hypothetical protein
MKTYKAKLKSKSPYSQSRHYTADKLEKEQPADYERRTWRNRMHVSDDGEVFIPPMAIKNCLQDAAKFLSIQIPGKGKATYTKHFEAGVLVVDELMLGINANDVAGEELFVPSDGRPGGGKRVLKVFPLIPKWEAEATIHVVDETITEDVLKRHLDEAGTLIGMGRFRPRKRGFYGRFDVVSLKAAS